MSYNEFNSPHTGVEGAFLPNEEEFFQLPPGDPPFQAVNMQDMGPPTVDDMVHNESLMPSFPEGSPAATDEFDQESDFEPIFLRRDPNAPPFVSKVDPIEWARRNGADRVKQLSDMVQKGVARYVRMQNAMGANEMGNNSTLIGDGDSHINEPVNDERIAAPGSQNSEEIFENVYYHDNYPGNDPYPSSPLDRIQAQLSRNDNESDGLFDNTLSLSPENGNEAYLGQNIVTQNNFACDSFYSAPGNESPASNNVHHDTFDDYDSFPATRDENQTFSEQDFVNNDDVSGADEYSASPVGDWDFLDEDTTLVEQDPPTPSTQPNPRKRPADDEPEDAGQPSTKRRRDVEGDGDGDGDGNGIPQPQPQPQPIPKRRKRKVTLKQPSTRRVDPAYIRSKLATKLHNPTLPAIPSSPVRFKQFSSFPSSKITSLPAGLTLTDLCLHYPNHVSIPEVSWWFHQAGWRARDVEMALTQAAHDQLSENQPWSRFQKRLLMAREMGGRDPGVFRSVAGQCRSARA